MTDRGRSERQFPSDAGHPSVQTRHAPGDCDVSVVVVTWKREEPLRRCLDSLAAQSFPRDRMEVVLVDVSDVPVRGVVAEFADRLRLRHVVFSNKGVAVNRNHGAGLAGGRWLAFIDDDCVADSEWLAEMVKAARADPRTMVGGRITISSDAGLWETIGQIVTEVVHAHFNPPSGAVTFLPGGCILVSRKRFVDLDGLDARFGLLGTEDRDFCDRWRESEGVLAYCPTAVVRHDHRASMRGFVRQQFNFGRGAWRHRVFQRQRVRKTPPSHPTRSLHALVRDALKMVPFRRAWQVWLAVPVWRLAYASGFLWQRITDSWRPQPTAARLSPPSVEHARTFR